MCRKYKTHRSETGTQRSATGTKRSETGTKRSETGTQRSETDTQKRETGPDSAAKTVTCLDRARIQGGQSWKDVCNGKTSQVSSWKKTAHLGKGKHG